MGRSKRGPDSAWRWYEAFVAARDAGVPFDEANDLGWAAMEEGERERARTEAGRAKARAARERRA
jgi:hypothetical protein